MYIDMKLLLCSCCFRFGVIIFLMFSSFILFFFLHFYRHPTSIIQHNFLNFPQWRRFVLHRIWCILCLFFKSFLRQHHFVFALILHVMPLKRNFCHSMMFFSWPNVHYLCVCVCWNDDMKYFTMNCIKMTRNRE